MAGIYIHIPFFKQACHYCNFHFSTSLRYKNDFIDALLKEISLQKDYLKGDLVNTLYFGGGTPSLLETEDLQKIMNALNSHFELARAAEVTLEANPDDLTPHKLKSWSGAGINRLSLGIQSFFEQDLRWMNRAHSVQQSLSGIKLAQDAGWDNLTIDLIYGTPDMDTSKWRQNLEQAVSMHISHLSCYALTVESKTALHKMIRNRLSKDVDPQSQAEQFLITQDYLTQQGYEPYEISNFALPGKRSRHNSSYWQGAHYLGLGPSAHSYNGGERSWNIANNLNYIRSLKENKIPFTKEVLTSTQQLNEYLMISLRTMEGCDLELIKVRFGQEVPEIILKKCNKFMEENKLTLVGQRLVLTRYGRLFADGIAADLFFEQEDGLSYLEVQ